jgi:streptogramin lyase
MRNSLIAALVFFITAAANAAPPRNPTIQGTLYGGQQPVVGSHVYLFEPGITTGTSKSILKDVPGSTVEDSNGNYYVTTVAPGGTWSVTGDYTCDAKQPVYIYASGGDPGDGNNNTAIGLMAFLGICPSSGGTFSVSTFINVNEVTTVAVAYAVAGYATDTTHISYDGTTLALGGITNAFYNVNSLVNQSTGTALPSTLSGSATVPEALINTLADVLATCVNTASSSSAGCTTLFSLARADGTSSGLQPLDTGTAAINTAHHPGVVNFSSIINNFTAQTTPFLPDLAEEPNDLTISLIFTGNGIGDPWAIAIDSLGDAWIASVLKDTTAPDEPGFIGYEQGGSIVEISADGTFLSSSNGYASSFFSQHVQTPAAIAIDASNNAWVGTYGSVSQLSPAGNLNTQQFLSSSTICTDQTSPYYQQPFPGASGIAFDRDGNAWVTTGGPTYKLSSLGSSLTDCGYVYVGLGYPIGIAVDNENNVWIADFDSNLVVEMNPDGSTANSYSDPSFQSPNTVAVDNQNNVWIANFTGTGVSKLSSLYGVAGFIGGGLYDNVGVGIDGAGDAWFTPAAPNNIGVVELSPAGVPLSGSNGYATGAPTANSNAHYWSAIDGSGNVWIANTYAHNVTELIGAATPIVTPLAAAVVNGTLGSTP